MSKCHVEELLRLYAAVFQDVAYRYPALRQGLERDLTRVGDALKQRGLHAACVDLPALGKHLDRSLSEGQYIASGLPLSRRQSVAVPIPKFLGGLYLLVFESDGRLKGEADVEAVLCLRQILYLAKAAHLQCGPDKVIAEMRSFVETDANLPIPEAFWDSEESDRQEAIETYRGFAESKIYTSRVRSLPPEEARVMSVLLGNLDVVSGLLATTLGSYSYEEWSFRHGPGAIAERKVDGHWKKFHWKSWPDRLQRVFPIDACGYYSALDWVDRLDETISGEEPYSRLIDVPKTYSKPRLIAAEPGAHMWCQQNIWHYLSTRVRDSWIGQFIWFNDQTRNQRLCTVGSRDGSLATIDLSAASDRVSCHAVGQLFRGNPELLVALKASRTRWVRIPKLAKKPLMLKLNKFSTMGSACTFPVETLLFFCVAISAVLTQRSMRPTLKNIKRLEEEVTVFGDDIIVPVDSRELVCKSLGLLDFKVNAAKTFGAGRFRESCGVDAFRGHDVTPAKWNGLYTGEPESYAAQIDMSNNFYSKFFVHVSSVLDGSIEKWRKPPLVTMTSGFPGFRSFVRPSLPNFSKVRWNEDLQTTEYLLPRLEGRVDRYVYQDGSRLFQYFLWAQKSSDPWECWDLRSGDPRLITSFVPGYADYPQLKVRLRWVPEVNLVSEIPA